MTLFPDDLAQTPNTSHPASQPDPTALLGELLASSRTTNHSGTDRQQALMQMMALLQQPEPVAVETEHETQRRRRAAKLRRHIDALEIEVEELRHRNDALAGALGACHLCWGEHDECDACNGRGRPGWFRPDVATSRQIIGPAIERLRFEQRRARPFAEPPTTHRNTPPVPHTQQPTTTNSNSNSNSNNQPSDLGKDIS